MKRTKMKKFVIYFTRYKQRGRRRGGKREHGLKKKEKDVERIGSQEILF